MKKDQVHTFKIQHPLTPARRKEIEKQIEDQATTTTEPVSFAWDAEDDDQLHIDVGPVKLDVVFYDDVVELYVDAPLWARVMITKEQETSLSDLVLTVLQKAGLSDAGSARTQPAR